MYEEEYGKGKMVKWENNVGMKGWWWVMTPNMVLVGECGALWIWKLGNLELNIVICDFFNVEITLIIKDGVCILIIYCWMKKQSSVIVGNDLWEFNWIEERKVEILLVWKFLQLIE